MFYYIIDAQLFLHPQYIPRNKHCLNYIYKKTVYLPRACTFHGTQNSGNKSRHGDLSVTHSITHTKGIL